jgi:transcriptional regulator with XRE-family HTH domain
MTERERIGALIASIRKEKGLTQEDLATICGMKKQHISRIEHGMYSVGIEILAKIGEALGRKIDLVKK